MKLSNIQPISYLHANTSAVIKQVHEVCDPIAITVDGRIQAIIEDPISYQRKQDALKMLCLLAHGRKQITEGEVSDHADLFSQLKIEDEADKI